MKYHQIFTIDRASINDQFLCPNINHTTNNNFNNSNHQHEETIIRQL